jgi:hypothetical protein
MNFDELQTVLKTATPFILVRGGQIDKDAPEVIAVTDLYFQLFKKKVGIGTCRNCIFDAFFELKQLTNEKFNFMNQVKQFKLKRFPIYFGPRHGHYTNVNITDEIAIEMVKFNRVNAANFENPDELLKAAENATVNAAAVNTIAPVIAEAPTAPTAVPAKEPTMTVSVTEKEAPIAPVAPKEKKGKKDTQFKKKK